MKGSQLRTTLGRGDMVYGTFLEGYGQPRWPRLFAQIGLDFVVLDTEHTPQDRQTVAWATQAYSAFDVAPLVRIPEVSAAAAAQVLDLGAHGIIVPYVETVEEVKEMVGAVKLRPFKGEGLRQALYEGTFPTAETEPYLTSFNEEVLLVIMIESPAGVRNLSKMLAVGGVDAVLIGPHDFSVSHGIPEQYDSQRFIQQVEAVIGICNRQGVSVGLHAIDGDIERESRWIECGCNFVLHSSDTICFAHNMARELNMLRQRTGINTKEKIVDGGKGHAK